MKKNSASKSLLLFVSLLAIASFVLAVPSGPTITYISNSTSPSSGIGSERSSDEGGTITILTLNTTQQNYGWKAYVGNVSGKLSLDDVNNWTIYDWSTSITTGEVYVSRNQTVDWFSVNCTNYTEKLAEDTFFSNNQQAEDSINVTFASTIHKPFIVAGRPIQNSSCYSTATYVNDTAQILNETTSMFQELLLSDDDGNMAYTTIMEIDQTGYDNKTHDFQLIVAETQASQIPTLYYFYVELGS